MDRRTFIAAATTLAASAVAAPSGAGAGAAAPPPRPIVLYASLGPRLVRVDLTAPGPAGVALSGVALPASVQYASFHPSARFLYVATSTAGPGGLTGNEHYLSAFAVDAATGDLRQLGDTIALPWRPIHALVDASGRFLLVAYPVPGTLQAFPIGADGRLGAAVPQAAPVEGGAFVHQVRVLPSGRTVFVVARGNDAAPGKAEDLGAFTTFDFRDGALTPASRRILPPETGPRSIDFHPTLPLAYVAMERGNALHVYGIEAERLSETPLFVKEVLQNPENRTRVRQRVGAGIVHPDGRCLYVVNRADKTTDVAGTKLFAGGENNIAVYALDAATGEPTLIQHLPCAGVEPRTLEICDAGRTLIVGNQTEMRLKADGDGAVVRSNLAFFDIGADGTLTYRRKYAFGAGPQGLVWMGSASLPA
jgi:6-phosphogluconolactonase (cycloisomerase 2 family)